MPTQVIMPALEMAQDNGKLLRWLKNDGDAVKKGEPLMEIETDKAAVEIEAPADGILRDVSARAGDVVPVGKPIAYIFAANESMQGEAVSPTQAKDAAIINTLNTPIKTFSASPVAQQIAKEHGIDLAQVKAKSGRVEKADVLAFLAQQQFSPLPTRERIAVSPKAKRLAQERNIDIATIRGTGPDGAVIAADILSVSPRPSVAASELSTTWRIMAERTTANWTSIPHFFLLREVNASRVGAWRERAQKHSSTKITYTDLLVKLVATTLRDHPRVNSLWNNGAIKMSDEINIGLAVATDEGLVVPVIHRADELTLQAIAARREDVVTRANASKLRPDDLRGGTFTISNLGMYGVDAFNAIINAPQAAILAVGRIAERVVPVNGAPAVQPMLTLSLSCDHRVIDGARGAQFLQALAELIEEPLGLLE